MESKDELKEIDIKNLWYNDSLGYLFWGYFIRQKIVKKKKKSKNVLNFDIL